MRKFLIRSLIVIGILLSSNAANAQIPVTDGANLAQQMQQFLQMIKEYQMLKQQYDQLKQQYEAITGNYGFGNQFNNNANRRWVPGSWQEVVSMQRSGKFASKQDFYEKLLKTLDPIVYKVLGKDTDSRAYHSYKLSTDATRGAFAAVEALYDSIAERLKNIEGLQAQIESTRQHQSCARPWQPVARGKCLSQRRDGAPQHDPNKPIRERAKHGQSGDCGANGILQFRQVNQ